MDLRWEQIELENAILHVRRVKQGTPATHPLTGRELRALRRLQGEQESKSPFVFVSERGTPFSNRGFQAMVERVARAAGFDMKIHPHNAAAWLRLQTGERWRRYAHHPKLFGPQVDPAHRPIYRVSRRPALRAYFGISMYLMTHGRPQVRFAFDSLRAISE